MKRWVLLLALPYVVAYHPSIDYKGKVHEDYSWDVVYSSTGNRAIWDCFGKEACEDVAFLMNEAHQKRVDKDSEISDFANPEAAIKPKARATLTACAGPDCGANDCGKEAACSQ